MFEYVNSITFIGGFFEVANNVINAENFVNHRYNVTESECEVGMKNAKQKVLEDCKNTQFVGLHNKYPNLYALTQYKRHDSKTIETLANINNIANSNVQAHYSPEYFSSPEEQRIENKKNADFATYVAENTDYENINSKIIKIEKNITQTRSSIAIARYVNQEFNELVRTQYPQFYYDIESAESIFCIENTGANSSPDCIGYGERKLEDIAKQAYKDIKILDRSSNELQDLYKQKTDIVTKLSNNFQQTNAYTQYKGDIATAKNNNNNGQYIEFYNKVNAWKQSVGTNLTEINLDTFTEIESNFGKMYGEFEILLENLNTLDASPQEKKLMQEVLNGQFASYAQVFLVASNRLNDNMKKSNNRHVYISPVVAFLKKKGALNVAHKDGFDDFKQSSNEQGASVDSQVLYNNQQLLKGVIENSQWPYWLTSGNDFVISSKCEANKALRPILASAGRGETSTSTCHGQMKGCGEDGIKGVKNDRSCQTAGQVITESKLKDKYEYPGFSDNQIDDMLMFRFSSIADPRQNVEVTVHQGVVNHVWPYQGTWFYERFSKIFGAVDYIKKGTTFSNALGSKIVDPKSPESTRLKEYIKSGRELDSNMHDLITLNTHPEFFTAYFTVMQTIEYDRSKNSNNAKLNNDPTLQTQIDGLNQQYVITNNNPFTTCLILSFDKNNINYNPANISNYTEYLSSYYIVRRGLEVLKTMNQNSIALSNAAKITGILHLKTISKECGPVDTYNKNNPETFKDTLSSLEPYMREFGVPVFEVNGPTNKAGKMNVSAVLSLIGVISPDGIKEMPALTSGDSSIYIPKGLFSQEKMRDYANQLMPEIKSPNDYKAFIFGQCTNAIVTGNLKKSKECVTVLKAMQLEAVPNNPYFFDQIGNFIKEANKLIKTIDASYIIPEEVIFDVEHAKQLIKEPLKPNLAERIFVFHQLTKIQNTLLDLTNTKNHLGALSSIKTIHEKIANSLNALESKIALLLALGYKNIATYEKETNTFANINHDLIEKIQKSCPYFHSYESIKPNYATAINLYNNIGYYTSEASLSSYITAIHGAMLRDYYNNKLPKTDPLITEFSTYKTITEIFSTLETAFKQSITQPKKAMEFQRMMAYLYNFYINRSDLIAGVNIELFGNDLFHGDKINYLGLAKAFLPTSSTNLEKLNDVYPEAIKQIVTNNNNYNDYKQWLNTQNLTPDVKALALKVLETTEVAPSSIKLDLNIYNNEQSKDIKKYNQFVSSLSGNDFDSKIVKRHIHTLKSVFSLGSPLKVFNIATLAILLDDGLINRGDIQDANGKDASKSAKALAKIKTLIKTYQKYAEFDTSVTPYTLSPIQQEGINTAFNGNIPTSVPTIANVDATLDNNFISIPNRQKLTSEGRTYYKIKLNKEAGIKALTNLLEICNIHNAALVDFQTRFYHPNTDANKLHKQFSDFSKNLAQTLGKFEDLELASRNHENILNFKARVVTVIENFKSEYNDITIKSPYLIEPYNPFIDHFDKHKKFSEFKKNLVQILVKSINPVVKEWMGAMIENFNSAYNDATNKGAYRLGLNNPLTNQFYNKDVIAINPIKNPYFEYNLDLLKKKIVRKARSASDVEMSDENNNVEMEIEDGTNVNLQDVAEKYPDTMIWIKMKNGQNQIITINKNNILSLRSEINALDSTNIEQIDIETPDRIFTRDGNGVTRKALLPTVIESILRAQDSNVKNIPIQHIFYDDFGNRQYADSSNLDYKYYNLVSLNKIYAQKAREDMSAELSTLLTKHGIDKAEFANFIKSTSEIDVEASKYGPLLKDVALSSNRFKNFVLSKIKYNSNITIGESQNSNAKVDLALGELEIHIPKFENILSYNDKQKSQLLGILQYYDKSVTLTTEMQAPNNADFAKMKAIYVQEISNMQSMYDGIDDADIHKIHAKLFLDTMNILVDKGTTSTIGALKTHFTNFLKKNQSISSNQIANIVNAINGYFFDNVTDLESFAAISSNIAISILGKDSSGINNAIGAINNFALPNDPNTYSDALTNNLNWLLSSKVIEQAKTLSNPFKLSMIAREQADKMEMDMLLGETGVTDDVSYLMSNIGTDLFPISYQTLAPSGRGEFIDSNFLPKSILPVQENIPDTKMPTIATSILLSAFNGHNAVLEGVRYLFNKVSGSVTDDELRKLKTVFYDSNRIKTSKSKVGSEINNAIRTVLANNNHNQISFLIETHGLPGTKVLGDDNHEWKMMNLDMGTNVNDPANFIYLFDQVVKQRIDNQNKNIPQSKTLDVRFNLHACQAAQPSNDFRKQTGLSDAFPITTINDSALSNMKLALDEYASKNSADLKKAGINDVILTGFYGEVYINPIGMNSQTLNTNTGSYLRLSKNFGSGGSSTISDEWGASHHNIQNNKKVLGKKTPNLPSKPGNCLGS